MKDVIYIDFSGSSFIINIMLNVLAQYKNYLFIV